MAFLKPAHSKALCQSSTPCLKYLTHFCGIEGEWYRFDGFYQFAALESLHVLGLESSTLDVLGACEALRVIEAVIPLTAAEDADTLIEVAGHHRTLGQQHRVVQLEGHLLQSVTLHHAALAVEGVGLDGAHLDILGETLQSESGISK